MLPCPMEHNHLLAHPMQLAKLSQGQPSTWPAHRRPKLFETRVPNFHYPKQCESWSKEELRGCKASQCPPSTGAVLRGAGLAEGLPPVSPINTPAVNMGGCKPFALTFGLGGMLRGARNKVHYSTESFRILLPASELQIYPSLLVC